MPLPSALAAPLGRARRRLQHQFETTSNASEHDHHSHPPDKLRFLKTPVVGHGGIGGHDSKDGGGPDYDHDLPRFARHEEPTLLELFFDLFFAANYNVFSENQEVTNHSRFKAYVGYFCLLWLTWFLVTLYDVRFVTDSIFARVTRAIQLGVLVGFAVVAPKFDPTDQSRTVMRSMSIILAVSRACLAVEYVATLWHVRKFRKARLPLYLQTAVHAAASVVYLGITFRFRQGRSRVFMTWYFISGAEGILTLVLSNFSPVLSLTKTHLMKRMTLLTVMMLGDGIVQIGKEVVTIVKTPDAWNAVTIGLVSAAAATIYFVFLIYFDWLRSSFHLPALRQQLWTAIHLPFHLSLVLFMQAFTQYLIWSKIVEVLNRVLNGLNQDDANPDDIANITTTQLQEQFNQTAKDFFALYPPKISSTFDTVNSAIANFSQIPNSFWTDLSTYYKTGNESSFSDADEDAIGVFLSGSVVLMTSMTNALFANFGINLESEITAKDPLASHDGGGFQGEIQTKTWERYRLVFAYGYVASGCTLLFMIVLSLIARTTPLRLWPIIRLVIVFLLALGMSLTAILWFYEDQVYTYLQTVWVLPTITFVWTIALIITHLNGHGIKRNAHLFKRRGQPYAPVDLPLTDWASNDRKVADGLGAAGPEAQHRSRFPHATDYYGGPPTDEIGVAYSGSDRPHSSYDPLKAPTGYSGAPHT